MATALLSIVILALTTCEVCTTESATIECGTIGNILELVAVRISRGEKTIRGEWPFLAALFLVKEDENVFFCGGSLISSKHVLTAARCIQDKFMAEKLLPGNVSVVLGAYNLTSRTETGVQQRDVQQIYVHPEWDAYNEKFDADLAILQLKEVVLFTNYIRPVCIPTNETVMEGVQGTVVGWGRTENGTRLNTEFIKRTSVTALNSEYCLTENPDVASFLSLRTFCGQGTDGNANRGDYGGGFYVENEEYVYIQRGIVSSMSTNSKKYADPDVVVVYTNVAKFKNWITDTVSQSGAAVSEAKTNVKVNLECVYRYYDQKYTCLLTDVDIRSDNNAVVSFSGSHLSQKTDEDVELITFRSGTLFFIPSEVGQTFKNVNSMQILAKLDKKRIERSDFRNVENLVDLRISKNEITTLDYDSLRDLKQLEVLGIVENKLTNIAEGTFETNLNLRKVYLYDNRLEMLPKHLFRNNLLLELVNLRNNLLTIIDEFTFETNNNLKVVDLQGNRLQVLPKNVFRNNLLLGDVDLWNNDLTIIDESTFETNIVLKKVDLQENRLEILPKNLFRNNLLLEYVNLGNNSLNIIDESTFDTNINLMEVYLYQNRLEILPKHLFRSNSLLEEVYLSINRLRIIDESTFQTNTKLKSVNLYDNKIEVLPRHLFRFNSLLEEAYFDANRLRIIEADFTSLKNINIINFRNNFCIDAYYKTNASGIYRNQFTNLTQFQNLIRTNCSDGHYV